MRPPGPPGPRRGVCFLPGQHTLVPAGPLRTQKCAQAPQGRSPTAGSREGSAMWHHVHGDQKPDSAGGPRGQVERGQGSSHPGSGQATRAARTEVFSQLSGLTTSAAAGLGQGLQRASPAAAVLTSSPPHTRSPGIYRKSHPSPVGVRGQALAACQAGSFLVQRPRGPTPAESALSTV